MNERRMHSGIRRRHWWLGAVLVLALVGCGKKGPLYLPDAPPPSPPPAPGK